MTAREQAPQEGPHTTPSSTAPDDVSSPPLDVSSPALIREATTDVATDRPEVGQEIEVEIDSLAFGGEGLGRIGPSSYVIFASDAIPGDRVRAVVSKRKRSYAHARTVAVLRASPERIPPLASHPGVSWQVLPYERQLQIKQAQVDQILRRLGRLESYEMQEIVPAVDQWRYRNKLEYSFGADPTDGRLVCGFHAPAGANQVNHIEDCLLGSPANNLARTTVYGWAVEQQLTAWERSGRPVSLGLEEAPQPTNRRRSRRGYDIGPALDGRARLRNLVVREGRRTGRIQVRLVTTEGELDIDSLADTLHRTLGDSLSGVLWTRSTRSAETTEGGITELAWGSGELPERLGDLDLRISPEAFFQTNTEMAEVLYAVATEYADLSGWERVFDLYSGIGTIALTLAPHAAHVDGIELVEEAVADATAGARRNQISKTTFFAGDTRRAIPELLARRGRPDVIVVDPPRAGLPHKVIHRIVEASPKRIVYISCNPSTLAPNASDLSQAGWTLRRVRAVDMFPQTPHIECVALLERTDDRRDGDENTG